MTATATEVSCPKCGSAMYDNRATKKNPAQPDFKCKRYKEGCDGVIWPPRNAKPKPTKQVSEYSSPTPLPGEDIEAELNAASRKSEIRSLHAQCFKHVCEVYVPVAAAAGVDLSLEGVSALTFQLFKAQEEVK